MLAPETSTYIAHPDKSQPALHHSPKLPNGARLARNVYAHSEKECEQKLAELIVQTKAEIAAQRQQPQVPA